MANSSQFQSIEQITVQDFAQRLQDQDTPLQLVDVREPEELQLAKLDGFLNLPLSDFANWSSQIYTYLDPDTETIVMCHHGMRSAQMCAWLGQQGFTKVKNLQGGIDAYSMKIDRSVPFY